MSYTLYKVPAKSISYGGTRSASQIRWLVYHYTGNTTDTARANANYFSANGSNTRKAGAHYFVDDTSVYQSIADDKIAYSVGLNFGNNNLFGTVTNTNSISIEMCSKNGAITTATVANAVELGKKLMEKYAIPIDRVVTHWMVCSKECPGWKGWYGADQSKFKSLKAALVTPAVKAEITTMKSTVESIARQTNSSSSAKVGSIDSGCKIHVVDKTANWAYAYAYVPRKKCSISHGKATLKEDCTARFTGSKDGSDIGTLYKTAILNILAETDNWLRVGFYIPLKNLKS